MSQQEQRIVGDNYDLNKIKFVSQKSSFKIQVWKAGSWVPVELETPDMYMPFGVEKFYYKELVNLEFTNRDDDNDMHNLYATVRQIDHFLQSLSIDDELQKQVKLSQDVKQAISGKAYMSSIRVRPGQFDPLLRVHLKKQGKTTKTLATKVGQLFPLSELKEETARCKLEVGSLWFTHNSYGINWILNSLELV